MATYVDGLVGDLDDDEAEQVRGALLNRRRGARSNKRVTGLAVERGRTPAGDRVRLDARLPDGSTVKTALGLVNGRVVVVEGLTITLPVSRDSFDDLHEPLAKAGLGPVHADWARWLRESAQLVELPPGWAEALGPGRIGRRGHNDAFYAEWVRRYVDACARSDTPMKLLQAEYPNETGDSLNRYVRKAGRLGLITNRPGHGKPGGEMTDRCRRILREGA